MIIVDTFLISYFSTDPWIHLDYVYDDETDNAEDGDDNDEDGDCFFLRCKIRVFTHNYNKSYRY